MKDLDLYKIIIFASIVLIPAGGVFCYLKTQELEVAASAIQAATRSGGYIEDIGSLQRELETVRENKRSGTSPDDGHLLFFERQILTSTSGDGIDPNDLQIGDESENVNRQKGYVDYEVSIDFKRGRKALPLRRDFLHAVLFNCEAISKGVWKLRELHIENVDTVKSNAKTPPPKTVGDSWEVKKMVFARRAPAQSR